jgi:hypothetical protein
MSNKFFLSLEAAAREAGMTNPVVQAHPDWVLFDEQRLGVEPVLVPVAQFRNAVDICNRISIVAAEYVAKPLAEAN